MPDEQVNTALKSWVPEYQPDLEQLIAHK